MAPGVLDKLPVDLYNAKPFVYKPTSDGYLLYSRGANGTDDGGSNDLLMGDVLRRHELQVWFLAEHLVDTPAVRV